MSYFRMLLVRLIHLMALSYIPWQLQISIHLVYFFEMVLESSVVRISSDLDSYL